MSRHVALPSLVKKLDYHPKLCVLRWQDYEWHKYDTTVYRGHELKIRFVGSKGVLDGVLFIGFIDGKVVGHDQSFLSMGSRMLWKVDYGIETGSIGDGGDAEPP